MEVSTLSNTIQTYINVHAYRSYPHKHTHTRAHTNRLEMGTFSLSRYCSALDIKKGWRNDKQKTASKRADEKENTTTIIKQNNKKHIRKESN